MGRGTWEGQREEDKAEEQLQEDTGVAVVGFRRGGGSRRREVLLLQQGRRIGTAVLGDGAAEQQVAALGGIGGAMQLAGERKKQVALVLGRWNRRAGVEVDNVQGAGRFGVELRSMTGVEGWGEGAVATAAAAVLLRGWDEELGEDVGVAHEKSC